MTLLQHFASNNAHHKGQAAYKDQMKDGNLFCLKHHIVVDLIAILGMFVFKFASFDIFPQLLIDKPRILLFLKRK
jgi:hypothetical protein